MKITPRFSLRAAGALTLAALLALAAGCANRPDVRTDQDPTAELTRYKTFAFREPAATDQAQYTDLLAARLKQATRAQLERAHYVYSERDPDLHVNLRLIVSEKVEIRSLPTARVGWRGWGHKNIESFDYRQGTLAIDLVDAKRNAVLWHGVAEGRLDAKAIAQPGPAIEAAVGEVFARFSLVASQP
jgi:Domain of unknown function (DUF4136)